MTDTNTAKIDTSSAAVSNHTNLILKSVALVKRRHDDLKDDDSAPPEYKENF
jgi:hypothetical protein